jgi:hypothetical protein
VDEYDLSKTQVIAKADESHLDFPIWTVVLHCWTSQFLRPHACCELLSVIRVTTCMVPTPGGAQIPDAQTSAAISYLEPSGGANVKYWICLVT